MESPTENQTENATYLLDLIDNLTYPIEKQNESLPENQRGD